MLKLLIVDDHYLLLEGLSNLLRDQPSVDIIGFAINGENCIQFLRQQKVDIVLLDISLPDMNGIELCKKIKSSHPDIQVIALTAFTQGSIVRKMIDNGASGYLAKTATKSEIMKALKMALAGRVYLCNEAKTSLRNELQNETQKQSLTRREMEVLRLIVDGNTNLQISKNLNISIDTVDSHRKNLHTKLNVTNAAQLVRYAIENKLI